MKNAILIILLVLIAFAELAFGSVHVSLEDVWNSLTAQSMVNENLRMVVVSSRLPRALTAIFAGSSLALGGMLMQTLFRNPLAGPSVLGVSSGASLGVALLVLSGGIIAATDLTPAAIAMAAIAGALAVLLVISFAARRLSDNTTLLIFGVMLSFFTGAIVDALQFHSSNESLRKYITWGMGSFSGTGMEEIAIMAIAVIAGVLAILPLLRKLDIFYWVLHMLKVWN
ncbi:MAG: iron chelate uptake ABC transporter family permease subunit [Flavobacteriales bacterium]|nr:iron chelate uptake ABC transporter family permease subunit [Flavobacteriales bacterium]